jgi:pantoate--beta-alanine ligase
MLLFKKITDLQKYLGDRKDIGFVPTMGALHSGHISLVKRSKDECTITVASIFVNPTQFNNPEDLAKYPSTINKDIRLLEKAGCDVLFYPSIDEIYPSYFDKSIKIDLGFVGQTLEGAMRPGHYDGVAQVVELLIYAVNPSKMYMGMKDYQQIMVVKEMIKIKNLPTNVISCETSREADGLAMSSRNVRLSPEARKDATDLSHTLFWIKEHFNLKSKETLLKTGIEKLKSIPYSELEYLEIRDAETLADIEDIEPDGKYVVLVACWVGGVRLIDNLVM